MTKQSKITAAHDMPVIEYLALADLTLSDLNPSKDVSEAGIALLADSLVTCGLIQNLAGIMEVLSQSFILFLSLFDFAISVSKTPRQDTSK